MNSPKKKFYLVLISLFSFVSLSFSQVDSRISDAFGKEYVERVQTSNSEIILYYTLFLEHGFSISIAKSDDIANINKKLPLLKPKDEFISKVNNNFTNASFNPFLYSYQLNNKHSRVYRLDDNGTIIEFYPSQRIIDAFNEKKNSPKTK